MKGRWKQLNKARIEDEVAEMGFELVQLERGGSKIRPLLRLRIDRCGATTMDSGITVADCAAVTRRLREVLEEESGSGISPILEVSSPGVERPLTKSTDYDRFAGAKIRVKGYGPLVNGIRTLDGTLLGLVQGDPNRLALETDRGRVELSIESVASARLMYSWGGGNRDAGGI